jgi:acyl-CoA hydrolase
MRFNSIEACVDAVIGAVGNNIVLGIPLGVGKPNTFVNALYRRVKENPALHMKLFTALSLSKPKCKNDLERRFLEPFVERVFGDYPDLDYVADVRDGTLPPNIEVFEFFMRTGEYLNNAGAQQHYIYSNYSHVARDMLLNGINVMAQAVACEGAGDDMRLSLSSNPDVTLDMIDLAHTQPGANIVVVGVINRRMPFMPNGAEVGPEVFSFLVDDPAGTHEVFSPPNMKVSSADYAIGLYASSLVKDGGTLQIGIGSLGDAIARALIIRDRENERYRRIMADLLPAAPSRLTELGPFETGLYGCSEMFVNGFLQLIEAGIIRREVFPHPGIQRLLNAGKIGMKVDGATLRALVDAGVVNSHLGPADVALLKRFGIFRPNVELEHGMLVRDGIRLASELADPVTFDSVVEHCLGTRLAGGMIMHGGFFLGPRAFYERLRTMPREVLAKIDMTRIGYINQLYGQEEIARLQRLDARFMNTTMMVTLLGAAVSDSLANGRLVSGVGGQYNFVAMGHELVGARSMLMLRSTRTRHDKTESSIVWNYAHTTIPRHLRDVVITEYGVADLRGLADAEVAKRLLAIADSRFQEGLLAEAKANGKIAADYEIPAAQRQNLPDVLEAKLKPWHDQGLLPDFPFGTDFTDDELAIVHSLKKLKHATEHPVELVETLFSSLFSDKVAPEKYLERMHFDHVNGLKEWVMKKLFVGNL